MIQAAIRHLRAYDRRLLYRIGLLLIALFIALIIFIPIAPKKKPVHKNTTTPQSKSLHRDNAGKRVFIKRDQRAFGDDTIDDNVWNSIEHTLYAMSLETEAKNLYTGTIQPGSYSHNLSYTPSGSKRTKSFRVYIEPIRITYTVFIVEHGGNWLVYSACAPKEFQIDKSTTCREIDWG